MYIQLENVSAIYATSIYTKYDILSSGLVQIWTMRLKENQKAYRLQQLYDNNIYTIFLNVLLTVHLYTSMS